MICVNTFDVFPAVVYDELRMGFKTCGRVEIDIIFNLTGDNVCSIVIGRFGDMSHPITEPYVGIINAAMPRFVLENLDREYKPCQQCYSYNTQSHTIMILKSYINIHMSCR